MHEMGVANSILEAVEKELDRYPGRYATKVAVRIGEYAGVDPESLKFCFEALVKGTGEGGHAPLELAIEWRPGAEDLDVAYLELEDAEKEVAV
jgi:Zn finger protein HypA/HybF involved in hydrogenase expression